jgi:hypothetical protein
MRKVPADSASDSDSSGDAVLRTVDAAAAAEQGHKGSEKSPGKQQQKHVCDLEAERVQHITAQVRVAVACGCVQSSLMT